MNNLELSQKTKELIAKFPNGKKLYHTNATFNMYVQARVRGMDEYELLEQIIQGTEDTQNALRMHLLHCTSSSLII